MIGKRWSKYQAEKLPVVGIVLQLDLARCQRLAIGLAEDRQQHAAAVPVRQQLPTRCRTTPRAAILAPFQHVEPPGVVGADRHVVGHEIEDQPEAGVLQRGAQPREAFLAAELRIERVVIDDVVAVRAAGARLEERRGVEMA